MSHPRFCILWVRNPSVLDSPLSTLLIPTELMFLYLFICGASLPHHRLAVFLTKFGYCGCLMDSTLQMIITLERGRDSCNYHTASLRKKSPRLPRSGDICREHCHHRHMVTPQAAQAPSLYLYVYVMARVPWLSPKLRSKNE